jgi:hypothetical protein
MTPTASKATALSKIHYAYENTYTDENRKKNNIEIIFGLANFATREGVVDGESDHGRQRNGQLSSWHTAWVGSSLRE